ncbi:Tip elongation aberrant protein 3 [Trichoplax sp. H2]|nr:Tip elongation aberrant protein 3 [Trichoplax sp. H2]|eukprot:RDD40100.1 Tip elongation aberrant protein 3 [Trichoplax sp. H2]
MTLKGQKSRWISLVYLSTLSLLSQASHTKTKNTEITEWIWFDGSYSKDQVSLLPNKTTNRAYPGARYCTTSWTNYDGNIWLFGGTGFERKSDSASQLNSLWHYSATTGNWEVYLGDRSKNTPKPRSRAASCGIHNKLFVIFGGFSGQMKALDDLWLFSIQDKNWTKIKQRPKSYPKARSNAAYWCYNGVMWVYGGRNTIGEPFDDFWKLDLLTLTWKKLSIKNHQTPGSRYGVITWTVLDNLYLYGGHTGSDFEGHAHLLRGMSSDLWAFSVKSQNWIKLAGSKGIKSAQHGAIHVANKKNAPGCLADAASWTDNKGNLWMYGGAGCGSYVASTDRLYEPAKLLSNIWQYKVNDDVWIWHGNNTNKHGIASYGQKGQPSARNFPSIRAGAAAWSFNGTANLFGGIGHDRDGKDGYLNDMWLYGIKESADDTLLHWKYPFKVPTSMYNSFTILCVGVLLLVFIYALVRYRRNGPGAKKKDKRRYRYTTLAEGDQET